MKFKLDENIGKQAASVLRAAGHDVSTVADQAMSGAKDEDLFGVCAGEDRALVTLDHDFGQCCVFHLSVLRGLSFSRLLRERRLGRLKLASAI